MLRLWPETIAISLFPGVAWVERNGTVTAPMLSTATAGAEALLDQMRRLLDAQNPSVRAGTRVQLIVSDTAANIVALPWQPELRRVAEVNAYARACFEVAGFPIDDSWTMHAEFRDLDTLGLAYALPNIWLDALLAELTQRQLVLANVLPLSAALYFNGKPHQGAWPAVMTAREHGRHIACVFGSAGLIGYDVEATIGSPQHSAQRLAGRVATRFGAAPRQAEWIADASTPTPEVPVAVGTQPWRATA